ncbi:MAG: phosphoribosylformylglycinamidine cyclo-ligase [Candidatus Marinimicrobia bacterium]|nr:phosphoribosylformylglycinamidine cyclo-ligase [Candidatus Neomarinimicrobiota bacterium]MBL7023490.1 phosphoribosylformylglycinamidine cyclo-ligase [Candidatus Neomarinimicrobiota bacterium]MBL7109551.1 phosphoribosylformylglycinamidine cyclo-ligase [Candidatus Neomarinimicrobiota bacterium]
MTYKDAGVDIDAGQEAVKRIKNSVQSTFTKNVLTDIGSFGGCFQFPQDQYKNPVLVSSADGVGTKLKIAILSNKHNTVGQCLVNHCVNDILALGAQPLFFLDYFACGKLVVDVFENVVDGFSVACKENNCALIGGETAEMPDFYQFGDYDISGTIVGVVDKENLITNRKTSSGDILIGLPSTGLHTNGYSLARKVLLSHFDVEDFVDQLDNTLGDELLSVHKSYLPIVKDIIDKEWLTGISHITGGGIIGNTKRILQDGQELALDWSAWEWLPIFKLIQKLGNVPTADMRNSMNLGIGMILVVKPEGLQQLVTHLELKKEQFIKLGTIK